MSDLVKPGSSFAGQKYKIVKLLGKGGMSEVWEAERTSHGGHVALKILALQYALREDFVNRLRTESLFYAVLTHPNIVRMLDADQEEQTRRVYIVMELLKGKTLRQLLTRHQSLKWIYALHILNQLADAMTLAHSKGILHRDLKPENLMISTDPANKGHLSVLDFGIAKWADNRLDTGALPQMGTARYMAPEQVKSLWTEHRNLTIDGRADIYAFGVIGYEIITGRHIFIDDRSPPPVEVILNGHLTAEVKPIQSLAPDCPDALAVILEKCLEKDRDKRYPGMRELWDDLNSFRVSIPAEHPLAMAMADSKRKAARRRTFAAAAELADEPEDRKSRPTAPMPDSFTPPLSALPFAVPQPAPSASRPLVAVSTTEPLPTPSANGRPEFAQNVLAADSVRARRGEPEATAPPMSAATCAAPETSEVRSAVSGIQRVDEAARRVDDEGDDDPTLNARGQMMPPPPASRPSGVTVQRAAGEAPARREASPNPRAAGFYPAAFAAEDRVPAHDAERDGAMNPSNPAMVTGPTGHAAPDALHAKARRARPWARLPPYVVGPIAGLGIAVAGAVVILAVVRTSSVGGAAEQSSATAPTSAPIPATVLQPLADGTANKPPATPSSAALPAATDSASVPSAATAVAETSSVPAASSPSMPSATPSPISALAPSSMPVRPTAPDAPPRRVALAQVPSAKPPTPAASTTPPATPPPARHRLFGMDGDSPAAPTKESH